MKTQRRSPRSALRLSAMEATRWCRLGFQVEDDSQDQRGAEQILQIDDAADFAGSLDLTCMNWDKGVSVAEHLHNVSPCSLHSMIECLPRLGMLFYILSRLAAWVISAKAWHPPSRGARPAAEACYSISITLAVSAEAWHVILYLVTP